MKKHRSFALLFSISVLPLLVQAQPLRRALIIAVGKYAPASEWPELASNRDANLLQSVLLKQGFSEQNIQILRDNEATFNGIEQAFQALIDVSQPGDAVLIHFSGHGQQVADDNGDEADGYDEALVPFDSPMRFQPGEYEGERLFRDEKLGYYVNSLRQKLGASGSILVLLDACHSGTGLRGNNLSAVRGTDQVMASTQYQQEHRDIVADKNAVTEGSEPEKPSRGASVVAFFAASAHELNYESRDETGQRIGSLSRAFCKAYSNARPAATYRMLFEHIKTEISAQSTLQNPQAEGSLDRRIADGQIGGYLPHFRIKTVADTKTLLLDAGQFSGITEGAELAFYPSGTQDTLRNRPIAVGKVISSEALESIVALKQPVNPSAMQDAWAYLRTQAWQTGVLRVQVALPESIRTDSVMAALKRWQRVVLVEKDSDFQLANCTGKPNSFCLNARGQSAERVIEGSAAQPNQVGAAVLQALSELAMANFLRGLSIEDEALQARLEIVPIRKTAEETPATLSFRAFRDTVALRVRNLGTTGCYYTLIDIQPDGQINVALPEPGRTAADYYLKPGATRQFDFITFAPPIGTEVFKLIVSREPLDLRQVVQTKGASRSSSGNNFLENLLVQRFDTGNQAIHRGVLQVAPGGVSVHTLLVQISR